MTSFNRFLSLGICLSMMIISQHDVNSLFSSGGCSKCICLNTMIHCSRSDKIKMIPYYIDRRYTALNIQHAQFNDATIYKRNMTGLVHLVELKIHSCNLRSIERFAFENMKKLKILDLSNNRLNMIQPFAFSGLNLDQLYIESNEGLKIYDHSFMGLNTTELSLRSSGIDDISYNSVKDLHLSRLILFNNSIRVLDWKFESIFDSSDKLIDLTSNPLHCNCQIAWLLRLIKKWQLKKDNLKNVDITCGSPAVMTGRELIKMRQEDLPCKKPFIKEVHLDIHSTGSLQLVCKSFGYPAPGLFWSYIGEDGFRRDLKRSPVHIDTFDRFLLPQDYLYPPPVQFKETNLTLLVNITPSTRRNYTCTTWNEINDSQTIVVSVKGPPLPKDYYRRFPIKKIYDKNNEVQFDVSNDAGQIKNSRQGKQDNSEKSLPPESFSDYIFQKQFTLVEMIGAVVGTFAVTLGLLLIVSRCIVISRTKRNKNQKTYWTVNGSVGYSATGSHEYDVPRLDHVTYQPAKLDEIEFLDFKTQRKLYTGT